MTTETPFLAGLNIKTLGKKRRSLAQKMANKIAYLKQKNLSQLSEFFRGFIPHELLDASGSEDHSRHRIFSKRNTFWAFFSQVIDADGGCMEVVRKMQAYASLKSLKLPASSTSPYCQARKKLLQSDLMDILKHSSKRLDSMPWVP